MKLADLVAMLALEEPPVRFTAYDGSSFGRADAPVTLELATERGLRYLATAPGDLGRYGAIPRSDLFPPRFSLDQPPRTFHLDGCRCDSRLGDHDQGFR